MELTSAQIVCGLLGGTFIGFILGWLLNDQRDAVVLRRKDKKEKSIPEHECNFQRVASCDLENISRDIYGKEISKTSAVGIVERCSFCGKEQGWSIGPKS